MRVGSRQNSSSVKLRRATAQFAPGARKSTKPLPRYSAGTILSAPRMLKYFEISGFPATAFLIANAISMALATRPNPSNSIWRRATSRLAISCWLGLVDAWVNTASRNCASTVWNSTSLTNSIDPCRSADIDLWLNWFDRPADGPASDQESDGSLEAHRWTDRPQARRGASHKPERSLDRVSTLQCHWRHPWQCAAGGTVKTARSRTRPHPRGRSDPA